MYVNDILSQSYLSYFYRRVTYPAPQRPTDLPFPSKHQARTVLKFAHRRCSPPAFFLLIECTQTILPPSAACTARQIYRSAHRRHLPILPILIHGTHYKLSSQTILPPSAACPHLPRQGFANIRPRLFLYVESTFSTFFLTRRQPKTGKSLSRNGGHKKEICNHDGALARPQFKLVPSGTPRVG